MLPRTVIDCCASSDGYHIIENTITLMKKPDFECSNVHRPVSVACFTSRVRAGEMSVLLSKLDPSFRQYQLGCSNFTSVAADYRSS
jgi:hypothetical protein